MEGVGAARLVEKDILIDPGGRLAIGDLLSRPSDFHFETTKKMNYGLRSGAFWLHLPLENKAASGSYAITFDMNYWRELSIYLVRPDGPIAWSAVQDYADPRMIPQTGRTPSFLIPLERGVSYTV